MAGERYSRSEDLLDRDDFSLDDTRFARSSHSSATSAIMGVAMVGLLGGGPRLTMRAARVVWADGHGTRSRDGQLRERIRHRGD